MNSFNFIKLLPLIVILLCQHESYGQQSKADSLHAAYKAEMKIASGKFSRVYYPHRAVIYALDEKQFLLKIDSLKNLFTGVSDRFEKPFQPVDPIFIPQEKKNIEYFFDRMILDYPYFHENHTGNKTSLSKPVRQKLHQHLAEFNDPAMLASSDFKGFVEAFMRHRSTEEVKKKKYKYSYNKRLDAYLNLVPRYFSDQVCRDYWKFHYLFTHLDKFGSKNIKQVVDDFLASCKNVSYIRTIDSMYRESTASYNGHLIETYKTVNGIKLDLHIFLPENTEPISKRPAIVYFSGGSWTEGTPEWDFYNCASYAKKGWVAISVEYRIADRHETSPFEAVKDARSAIRWLRLNAEKYHIDPAKIVASGNSAGGHLVLCTALANEINEKTDNLAVSPIPDLLMVNAGVYSLFAENSTDWVSKGLKDKYIVKKVSPQHLLKPGLPPMIIIHGTNDQSVDYHTAKAFAAEMEKSGNDFEFHTTQGAPHYIWYDRRFSGEVGNLRKAFLKKYGYE